jgi:mono/diheme cytochrome c family protein
MMPARQTLWSGLVCAAIICARVALAAGDAERGKVVFALAGGCGCHTADSGPPGAGGGEVPTPFGVFYGTNITPDKETGIGSWSDADLAAAIRDGVLPDGRVETPAMPYYQYAGMSDADLADLVAYLRSLPPTYRQNRPHRDELPLARWAYRAWRLLFVRAVTPPAQAPRAGVERGRYLANHVSICTDCHTPRTRLGVPEARLYLAGTADGPGGEVVPNITPSSGGIGDWSVDDIVAVLSLGMKPNFDNVQGLMAEVVDGKGGGPGYGAAPASDLHAIATYLETVRPIDHEVRRDR